MMSYPSSKYLDGVNFLDKFRNKIESIGKKKGDNGKMV